MSCGVGHRHDSDPALLWLWCRPAAAAPIRRLAWEPPCAQMWPKKEKKKKKKNFKNPKNKNKTTVINNRKTKQQKNKDFKTLHAPFTAAVFTTAKA